MKTQLFWDGQEDGEGLSGNEVLHEGEVSKSDEDVFGNGDAWGEGELLFA